MIERIPLHLQPKRDPGPYPAERRCQDCGCVLSRNNGRAKCAPCQLSDMPRAELVAEVLDFPDPSPFAA